MSKARLEIKVGIFVFVALVLGSTPCYFGGHYRVIYKRNVADTTYRLSQMAVEMRVEKRVRDLIAKVTEPVIVWGCGDLCLHMLTKVKLDVVYYVDIDPAFAGAFIDGKPVFSSVLSGEPIVIIAQNQASGILKRIKELGIPNEVILI